MMGGDGSKAAAPAAGAGAGGAGARGGGESGSGSGAGGPAVRPTTEAHVLELMASEEAAGAVKLVRTDLPEASSKKPAFLVDGLLTAKECEAVVAFAETQGFKPLEGYPASYRNNDRVIVMSHAMVAVLFRRLKDLLPPTVTWTHTHDTMQLVGCNECVRFCRYNASGGHFNPHCDGDYRRSAVERSFLTLNMYLNDVPESAGGATRFLHRRGRAMGQHEVKAAVRPVAGRALIFAHDIFHDGQQVTALKYLMRSDIMYRAEGATEEDDGDVSSS